MQPLQPSTFPHSSFFGPTFTQSLADHPTILIPEFLFISLTLLCVLHASKTSKLHVAAVLAAVTSGTMNDLIFMHLPFADNFWHAQAFVMLTPRLPLYIPFAYAAFQYVGFATALRLPSSPDSLLSSLLGRSAYAGLVSCFFYALYDLVGARFLWWTWHTSDAAVYHRWHGVPIGSTMWTLVHVFVFSFIIQWKCGGREGEGLFSVMARGVAWTGLLCTSVMMVCMGPFQMHQLEVDFGEMAITQFPGKPDVRAISAVITLLSFLARKSVVLPRPPANIFDAALFGGCVFALLSFLLTTVAFDPSNVVSTGIHQKVGNCKETDNDLSGYERYKYYCGNGRAPEHDGDLYFEVCREKGKLREETEWYTVCGVERGGRHTFLGCCVAAVGIYLMIPMIMGRGEGGGGKVKKA